MSAQPPFLSILETAECLNTTERMIRRLIAERRIGFVRLGRWIRIPMSAIEALVKGGTVLPRNRRVL